MICGVLHMAVMEVEVGRGEGVGGGGWGGMLGNVLSFFNHLSMLLWKLKLHSMVNCHPIDRHIHPLCRGLITQRDRNKGSNPPGLEQIQRTLEPRPCGARIFTCCRRFNLRHVGLQHSRVPGTVGSKFRVKT